MDNNQQHEHTTFGARWLRPVGALVSILTLTLVAGCGGSDTQTDDNPGTEIDSGTDAKQDVYVPPKQDASDDVQEAGQDVEQPDADTDGGDADADTDGGDADADTDGGDADASDAPDCEVTGEEVCDGIDNDCDGLTDEYNPGGGAACDTKLKGICAEGTMQCIKGVLTCTPAHGPGEVAEICNNLDDDCNGTIDEGLPTKVYYRDSDKDGFGDSSNSITACGPTDGYVEKSGDCNDSNDKIYPGAPEVCNDADDDCDGVPDDGVQKPSFYIDNDGDGWGGVATKLACTKPNGYVDKFGDCNDFNKDIHPNAPEQCNNIDDNCNGVIDENVQTQTIYKDIDGDGFAPLNAAKQDKCNVPVGWTTAKDVDGDGKSDWDCDDSDTSVYPGAATKCGDNKDNNCDGYKDRFCFTKCAGSWPFTPNSTSGISSARIADLNGDASYEVVVQESKGFAILKNNGQAAFNYSQGTNSNYSRGRAVLADIDQYDYKGQDVQTMEVLTGNGSRAVAYKLNADGTVTEFHDPGGHDVYDASKFMASDIDHDGRVEFVTASWAGADTAIRFFRFDKTTGELKLAADVKDPDGVHQYTSGRMLTDLDGDGQPELVFGNGYAYAQHPEYWKGKMYAYKFTDTTALTTAPFCAAGTCFDTTVTGLYDGTIASLYRIGDQVRVAGYYFLTNQSGTNNAAKYQYWVFNLAGQKVSGPNDSSDSFYAGGTDVDRDGTPDNFTGRARDLGMFDVNGDGFPDYITNSGKELRVQLWDNTTKKFVDVPGAHTVISSANISVRSAWDMNGDGHLNVIASDANGRVTCYQMGEDTWHKQSTLPPRFPMFLRTYQWDNYEPNEGADTNSDGIPDGTIQIPSALTVHGDFNAYLSSNADKDYYVVNADWGGNICITSPKGHPYTLEVYSYADKWNNTSHATTPDGKVDGLIFTDSGANEKKCFHGGNMSPNRYGEYRFVIGVKSQNNADPYWPYWISRN